MTSKITLRSSLQVVYAADPQGNEAGPSIELQWLAKIGPVVGDLGGQTEIAFAPLSDLTRNCLILYPKGAATMEIEWGGDTQVKVPTLFVTTSRGYEFVDSTATHITVTNPTTGLYRFWTGELDADFGVYPGGEDTSLTTIPDTEVF